MQEAPEAELEQMSGEQNASNVTKLAQDAGASLSKFAALLNKSPAANDADREAMNNILSSFVDLVEKQLGGQESEEEPVQEIASQVPMQQGIGGVPMGPQTKQ